MSWFRSGKSSPVRPGRRRQSASASPQTQHHFTQADQVNQLVSASEADPDLGFMARLMALCSLPRTNPGNRTQYKRVNGPFTLYMNTTADNKLPYGNLPRLLMAWLSTDGFLRVCVSDERMSEWTQTHKPDAVESADFWQKDFCDHRMKLKGIIGKL